MATAMEQRVGSTGLSLLVGSKKRAVPQLRLGLLGGFHVERVDRDGVGTPVAGWQRRSAKALTKLLATCPRHTLHREQVLDTLWPDVEIESALNSFGKALYAARHALEPELLPRECSAYLRMADSMVALEVEHVWIDADHFQLLAEDALGRGDVSAYESALAAYGGELLPEDRYEDWCAPRRDYLAELHIGLLLELAEALASRGAHGAAAARLREVLQHDPAREDVHPRLMALYVSADKEILILLLALAAAARGVQMSMTDLRAGAAALQPPVSDATLLGALHRALDLRILEERNGSYVFRHPVSRADQP